jgi:membrane associated rhomboid family serine protease
MVQTRTPNLRTCGKFLLSLLALPSAYGSSAMRSISSYSRAEAWWERKLLHALDDVQTLPKIAARWIEPRSVRLAKVVKRLQVDSPLILSFASACIFVQAFSPLMPGLKQSLFAVSKCPALSPAGAFSIFGQVVGHSDWGHLRGNLLLLLLVGHACESALGPVRLTKIFACTSVASSLTHILLGPTNSVQLGASGVVFALILLNSCLERKEGEIPLTFVLTGALWLGRELGIAKAGVASSAHLVGAAVGTFFGHKMSVRRTWLGGSERKFED